MSKQTNRAAGAANEVSGKIKKGVGKAVGELSPDHKFDDAAEVAFVCLADDEALGCHGRSLHTGGHCAVAGRPQ